MALLTVSGLFVGIAVELDVIAYWMLLVAGAVQAAAFAFFMPARSPSSPSWSSTSVVPNAVVVAQIAAEGMRVVAPALAGLLIGVTLVRRRRRVPARRRRSASCRWAT